MTDRAGLLVRCGGERLFLPASLARCLLPLPLLTKVPWDSAQMALVGGEVVAVLELAPPSGTLLLCEHQGQALALSGLLPECVGAWPESGSGVSVEGETIPALDIENALEQFQQSGQTPKDSLT